jgi:PAS domain S-box-containing protein
VAEELPSAYRSVLAGLPDSILVVDGEGRIRYVNGPTEELTGRPQADLLGKPIEDLLPGDRRGTHRRTRLAYQRHPTVRKMGRNLDISLIRASGEPLDVDVALSPVTIEGRPMVVAAIRDISDQRNVERELRENRETIERLIESVHEYAILMLDPDGRIASWNPGAQHLEGYAAEEILGRHFSVFYTPADVAAGVPDRNLRTALQKGRLAIEGWRVRKDGSRYWANTVFAPVFDATGKLRGFSKVTRDMSDQRRTRTRIEAGLALSDATLRDRPARTLLLLLARGARSLTDAATAIVSTPAPIEGELQVTIALGPEAARLRGGRTPLAAATSHLTGPLAIEVTAQSWRRFLPVRPRQLPQQGIVVPVVTREELRAVVTLLGGSRQDAYDEPDLQALGLLVSQAAIALDYGHGRAAMRQIALVEDRERIARELHDGAIQAIFGVGLNLQAAAAMTSDEATAERLDDAVGRLDDVVRDLRNYVFGLRPGMLADLQLDRAIRRLVADLESSSEITFTLDVDPAAAAMLAGRGPDVLAVVNELLSNLRRHSDAAHAALTLAETGTAIRLELRDDGRGFVVDGPATGGQGLRNMRERVTRLGGRLEIDSAPGAGTTVRIVVPQ